MDGRATPQLLEAMIHLPHGKDHLQKKLEHSTRVESCASKTKSNVSVEDGKSAQRPSPEHPKSSRAPKASQALGPSKWEFWPTPADGDLTPNRFEG